MLVGFNMCCWDVQHVSIMFNHIRNSSGRMKPEWRAYLLRGVEATNHHRSAVDFRGVWAMDPKWSNLQIGTAKSVSVKVCGPLGAPVLILIHYRLTSYKEPSFFCKKNCPWVVNARCSILWFPVRRKVSTSLPGSARYPRCDHYVHLCPMFWEVEPLHMSECFGSCPASSSVTRKGSAPQARIVWPWECAVPLFLSRHYRSISI